MTEKTKTIKVSKKVHKRLVDMKNDKEKSSINKILEEIFLEDGIEA